MDKKILLIGGGGHCKSVLDSLLNTEKYSEIGIIGKKEEIGNVILAKIIIGCDDDLPELYQQGYHYAFITIGSIGNPSLRIKLYKLLSEFGFEIPNVIDRTAVVSRFATLENGIFAGKNSIINAGTTIEKCAIINSGAIVEHDCKIGEFVHIAPGAVLGGGVEVGDNTHIGSNSTIKQQIRIGCNSIIGMGSNVTSSVNDNTLVYGNPSREVRKL